MVIGLHPLVVAAGIAGLPFAAIPTLKGTGTAITAPMVAVIAIIIRLGVLLRWRIL